VLLAYVEPALDFESAEEIVQCMERDGTAVLWDTVLG
jgi:hypothetical protein